MGFAVFGPGILKAQRLDIPNQAPINVGYANEFSLDLSGSTKQLFGQNQYALVAARGTVKSSGKFKNAVISGLALNAVFFGGSLQDGGDAWVIGEAGTIPSESPYTVTVTGAADFNTDLGVSYEATGVPFKRVASGSEAVGTYSVDQSTGVYTFAAADEGVPVLIDYQKDTTTGQSLTLMNQLIGVTPTFALYYYTNLNQPTAKPYVTTVFNCVSSKLSQAFKLEDFMMPEIDFDIFANAQNQILKVTFPDKS